MRVLIADDEPNIVTALEFLLRGRGYEVDIARNGADALARIRDTHPDLVLLDVMMPELSGWQVLEQLRADPTTRETPVVITSAVYDRPGLHPLPPGGPVRFAAKPFDIAALLQTVRELAG